jgi:hypothetical protein
MFGYMKSGRKDDDENVEKDKVVKDFKILLEM